MNEEIKLRPGDFLGVYSTSFLGKSIRFFMKAYVKVFKLEKTEIDINHIAVVLDINGSLQIVEADKTVIITKYSETGYFENKNYVIIRDKRGYTPQQLQRMTDKALAMAGTIYQVTNFFGWVAYIFTLGKINPFKDVNEKTVYCSELGAILDNEAHPNTWKAPNRTNPYDFMINENKDILQP